MYLPCLAYIRNQKVSVVNEDYLKMMEMETHRGRQAKKGEDGNIIFSTPFKYIEAAIYLSDQPKCSDKYDDRVVGSVSSIPVGRRAPSAGAQSDGGDTRAGTDSPVDLSVQALTGNAVERSIVATAGDPERTGRPSGVKKMKARDAIEVGVTRASENSAKISKEVARGNYILEATARVIQESSERMEDINLLQTLKYDSDEHNAVFGEFMAERAQRRKRKHD